MRRRSAFTLVEMLVSLALTVFIMVILAEAFKTGLETFRQLKAIGDMDQNLRAAATIIRRDLKADHFEGMRRLSDTSFFAPSLERGPPEMGFFRIVQGAAAASDAEGQDLDTIVSRRRTTHRLHFTVKLRGNRKEEYFYARVPVGSPLLTLGQPDSRFQEAGVYASQWAEVAYFLAVPPGNPTAEGTPLFALYRRQRLLVPENDALNWGNVRVDIKELGDYSQISCMQHQKEPGLIYFNGPHDVTIPERRFGMNPTPGSRGLLPNPAVVPPALPSYTIQPVYEPLKDPMTGALTGDDLLLANVLSFDVQILTSTTGTFSDITLFDTWSRRQDDSYDYSTAAIPSQLRIFAIQITLRVWDTKTRQSRQVTIVQEL